jgi:hypothetical protein
MVISVAVVDRMVDNLRKLGLRMTLSADCACLAKSLARITTLLRFEGRRRGNEYEDGKQLEDERLHRSLLQTVDTATSPRDA